MAGAALIAAAHLTVESRSKPHDDLESETYKKVTPEEEVASRAAAILASATGDTLPYLPPSKIHEARAKEKG